MCRVCLSSILVAAQLQFFFTVNKSKCTSVFVNLFLHSSIVLLFFQYCQQFSQLMLGEPNPHKAIIFKSLKPWIKYMTGNVQNCFCYSNCLLVLCVLMLLFGLSRFCIRLHVLVHKYVVLLLYMGCLLQYLVLQASDLMIKYFIQLLELVYIYFSLYIHSLVLVVLEFYFHVQKIIQVINRRCMHVCMQS